MKSFRSFLVVALGLLSALAASAAPISYASFGKRPKLVLVLVIDQFRADYLTRFRSRFVPATGTAGEVGGFNYLMSRGAYYPFAQYDIMQSQTGPGHATILSGSYPYQSGIPLNYWWENGKGETYCTGDADAPIVGVPADSKSQGMSPRNFRTDTVGDELKNAGYPSKVVTIAIKDRAAILMGGHRADLALWFDSKAFHWVSSKYYLPDAKLPNWVTGLNEGIKASQGKEYEWKSAGPGTGLTLGGDKFARSTQVGGKESLSFPYGLELTELAAESALQAMKLGAGSATDLLAVSFSSHDYMAHAYGPNTRELEEMTVQEDRQIARLLNVIRRRLPGGLKDVVIALTADHGGPPSPAYLKTVKMPSDYMSEDQFKSAVQARLNEKFGKPGGKGDWISFVDSLNFWLSPEALADRKVAPADAEAEAKSVLLAQRGVAQVFTRADFIARKLPQGVFERQIMKTFFAARSADITVIPRPFYMNDEDPVGHQTGYVYDRTVPLILAGARLKPGVYSERAEIVDLAPTLAFLLGVLPPATSEGRVLSEALTDFKADAK